MQTTDFNHLELIDAWYEQDPAMRIRVGSARAAVPGRRIRH